MNLNSDMWVIFRLASRHFGISTEFVREMVALPAVRSVPKASPCVRGVANLRGTVQTVWDLRQLLGLKTLSQETQVLIDLLDQREKDHRNWLMELEACSRERRDFKLATDPHKCKFGLWYDVFVSEFKTDNLLLASVVKKFDEPHKAIHGIAHKTIALVKERREADALALIEKTRDQELSALISLFAQTRKLLKDEQREIGIVLNLNQAALMLTADAILSVERIDHGADDDLENLRQGTEQRLEYIDSIGHLKNNQGLVLLINPTRLPIGVAVQ
jgi:purine-binding chemotaxis protein CheW